MAGQGGNAGRRPAVSRRLARWAALAVATVPLLAQATSLPAEGDDGAGSASGAAGATGAAGAGGASGLASLAYCDAGTQLSAEQRDRLLRFAAVVKAELARSGAGVALIARSGLDLSRVGQRYSHAGLTLRASPESPWAVRQLYYACDQKAPRLFDQGISAFLMGTDDASIGYVSIVFLPETEAAALEQRALDRRHALALLGDSYSANAYPFSTRHQNCNQWLVELLASSWDPAAGDAPPSRERAQHWLRGADYAPTVFEFGARPVLWLAAVVPWLHLDDHPAEDLERNRVAVSMPASIEAFVRARVPLAERLELCHDGRQVVLRRGWAPLADDCRPEPGDEVRALP